MAKKGRWRLHVPRVERELDVILAVQAGKVTNPALATTTCMEKHAKKRDGIVKPVGKEKV